MADNLDNNDDLDNNLDDEIKDDPKDPQKGGREDDPKDPPKDDPKDNADLKAIQDELKRTREALKNANDEAKERRLKLKEYEELGLSDLEQARAILQEREEAELKRAEEEKNFTEWQERTRAKYEGQINDFTSKLEQTSEQASKYKQRLESYLVDNEALQVLKELDGEPTFILPHLKNEVRVSEGESGDMTVEVLDKHGDVRLGKDGKPLTIRDRLTELREDPIFGKAFNAPSRSGGGSGGDNGGKGADDIAPKSYRNEMTTDQKGAYISKYGIEKFNALPRSRPGGKK